MRREKDLTLNSNKQYNTTQLHVAKTFERHVFHRDIFAHYLRWTFVLNMARTGITKIVDFGCGTGELLELLYRNKMSPKSYVGLDIRKQTVQACATQWKQLKFASFAAADLVKEPVSFFEKLKASVVCSFEVMEHVNKKNGDAFLERFRASGDKSAVYLLSTPNFDPSVGAAQNHIYDGAVQEWPHKELEKMLKKYFVIEKKFGTFASVRDYKDLMSKSQREVYDQLKQYFDANLMSVIFAPMFPEQSRNTLWVMRRKS